MKPATPSPSQASIWIRGLLALCLGAALLSPANSQSPRFHWHDKWMVPFQACQVDPRFSYMMYVPKDYDEKAEETYPLVVLVHGTERAPHHYLEQNAAFAEEHDLILLAPLFPVGTHGRKDLENYKLIEYKGTRYDLILLSMVDEAMAKYRIEGNTFSLFGFSGGGHFAHRFFYLHPHRLEALSIGAPGMVTLIDDSRDWWVGTRDLYWRFNARLNPQAMRKVKVQMVVGGEDSDRWPDEIEKESPYYMPGTEGASYNAAGIDRKERLKTLRDNFKQHGIEVRFDIVPGAGHDETKIFPTMQDFFQKQLKKDPAAPGEEEK